MTTRRTRRLDRIEDLAAGRNPDAEHRPLPAGLGAALDPRRVGMSGWSKGATATALVMNTDRRVRAGLGFDGPMQSQPEVTEHPRPGPGGAHSAGVPARLFDRHLRDRRQRLLAGPSPAFPEVRFIP